MCSVFDLEGNYNFEFIECSKFQDCNFVWKSWPIYPKMANGGTKPQTM